MDWFRVLHREGWVAGWVTYLSCGSPGDDGDGDMGARLDGACTGPASATIAGEIRTKIAIDLMTVANPPLGVIVTIQQAW